MRASMDQPMTLSIAAIPPDITGRWSSLMDVSPTGQAGTTRPTSARRGMAIPGPTAVGWASVGLPGGVGALDLALGSGALGLARGGDPSASASSRASSGLDSDSASAGSGSDGLALPASVALTPSADLAARPGLARGQVGEAPEAAGSHAVDSLTVAAPE